MQEERHGRDALEASADGVGASQLHHLTRLALTILSGRLDRSAHGNNGPTVELPSWEADDASFI